MKSTASTPDEIRADLLDRMDAAIDIVGALELFPYAPRCRPGGSFDVYDTMAHFPCAGPHTVREVLDQLATEGVLEKQATRYVRARKDESRR